MARQRRYVAKDSKQTILRLLQFVFLAIVIVGGIVAAILFLAQDGTRIASTTALPFTSAHSYAYTGRGFLYEVPGGLTYADLSDEERNYNATVNADEVMLMGSDSIHALYNSAAINIVGAQDIPSYSQTLVNVATGMDNVAILWRDAAGIESVQVLSAAGEQKDLLIFEGQYIVDYGFYYDGEIETLYVHTLDIASATPMSTIHIFNMTSSSTSGVLQVQHQLIEHVYFTNTSIFIAGTNTINRYDRANNRESYHVTVYGWEVYDYDGASTFLLSPRSSTTPGILKVLSLTQGDVGEVGESIFQAPMGTLGVYFMGDTIMAITRTTLYSYDLEGALIREYSVETPIASVKKIDDNLLLFTDDAGSLSMYTLR